MSRVVPGIAELLQPVEQAIRQCFIPSLTGQSVPGKLGRDLFALPTRLGGLGLPNPAETSEGQFEASTRLTAPLLALVVQQHTPVGEVQIEAEKTRKAIRLERRRQQAKAAEQL